MASGGERDGKDARWKSGTSDNLRRIASVDILVIRTLIVVSIISVTKSLTQLLSLYIYDLNPLTNVPLALCPLWSPSFPSSSAFVCVSSQGGRWKEMQGRRNWGKEDGGRRRSRADDWMKVISKWGNQRDGGSQVAWCTGANYLKDTCSRIKAHHPALTHNSLIICHSKLDYYYSCLTLLPYIFPL